MKKLYRSEKNKVFGGVIGGIGEYFDIDPVLLRVIYVALTIFSRIFPGIIVYIIAFLVIPKAPEGPKEATLL